MKDDTEPQLRNLSLQTSFLLFRTSSSLYHQNKQKQLFKYQTWRIVQWKITEGNFLRVIFLVLLSFLLLLWSCERIRVFVPTRLSVEKQTNKQTTSRWRDDAELPTLHVQSQTFTSPREEEGVCVGVCDRDFIPADERVWRQVCVCMCVCLCCHVTLCLLV